MKLFKSTQTRLERVGIQALQPFEDSHLLSVHLKRALPICVIALSMISSSAFSLFKAKNIGEYTFSFYISIALMADFFLFGVCKVNSIITLIDTLQALIQKRRLNPKFRTCFH